MTGNESLPKSAFCCKIFFSVLISFFLFLNAFAQAPDSWTQKASMGGIAREKGVGMAISGFGYIGTGIDAVGFSYKDWWRFNPATNTWTQMANMPTVTGRSRAVGLSISGKGYVGTGLDGSGNPLVSWFEYDPASNGWTQKTNFPGTPRYSMSGFVIGNKGYIGTGFNGSTDYVGLWEYNPATDNWTSKQNIPSTSRYSSVGFSIGNHGCIGGGYTTNGNTYLKDFWRYDPVADSWIQVASLPAQARALSSGFSLLGRGFVVGGSSASPVVFSDLFEYNQYLDAWTKRASIPVARYGASSFVIGNAAFVGTGNSPPPSNNQLNDLWQYTPALINSFKFQKAYGGTGYDSDTANIAFASPTPEGGYIISSTTNVPGKGDEIYLLRTGAAGNLQWQRSFGGVSTNETSSSVMPVSDGGFVVAGFIRKAADDDLLVLKINSAGNFSWSRTITGAQDSRANYAEETRYGGDILIAGKGEGPGNNSSLMMLSNVGTQLLARNFSVSGSQDEAFSLIQTDMNNYIISGHMKPGATSQDAYGVAFDPSGNLLSPPGGQIRINSSPSAGTETRAIIRQMPDGGFIFCGSSNASGSTNGGYDFFIVKIKNDFTYSWSRIYGGTADDFSRSVIVTPGGNIAVTGYTQSFGNATDAFLSLIDAGGTPLWTKTYGGSLSDKANSLFMTADGGFLLGGETHSFSTPPGTSDIYLIKTDSLGNSGCNEMLFATLPSGTFPVSINPVTGSLPIMTFNATTPSSQLSNGATGNLCSQCTFPIGKARTHVKCFGGSTGTAAVSALGGAMPYTYAWSTGATTQSISNLPAGTYSVLVVDANSCTAVDTVKILQPSKLNVLFASDSLNICKGIPDTILTNVSGGIPPYSFSWSPATGLSCTTCQDPMANPSSGTNYYVVTVTDSNLCVTTGTVAVTVHSPPAASAGADQTICVGGNANIGNPSVGGMNYSWSPSAGLSSGTLSNPSASPVTTTTYVITVSNQIGCASKDTVVVNVLSTPTLSISPPSTSFPLSICSGSSISLTASSNVPNYQWSTGSSNATIVVSPSAQTGYTVTVSLGTCTVSASTTVNVIQSPVANIVNNGSNTVCTGISIPLTGSGNGNYLWSTGSTATTISVSYPSAGTYITTLTVTAGGGNVACSDVDSITLVAVTAPVVSATATSYTLCTGIASDTLIATNLVGANYAWSPGTHPNNDTILIGPFSVPGTVTYSVVVSTGSGCAGTATVSITVSAGYPAPTITPNPAAHCFGQPNQAFTCTNPLALVGWLDLSGNLLQLGPAYTPTVTAPGTYSFICIQGSGNYCLSSPSIASLTIYNSPTANAGANVTVCPGHTAALQASGGSSYQWSPSGLLSTATISNPSTSPDSTVSYQVIVTDVNGCSDIDSVTVFVIANDSCSIHIYNVFTPNNDGLNEGWSIDGINAFPENTVTIHNRWGDLVWRGENYDNTKIVWKGLNEKGNPLPSGTYYYVITINEKRYSSWVELLK